MVLVAPPVTDDVQVDLSTLMPFALKTSVNVLSVTAVALSGRVLIAWVC